MGKPHTDPATRGRSRLNISCSGKHGYTVRRWHGFDLTKIAARCPRHVHGNCLVICSRKSLFGLHHPYKFVARAYSGDSIQVRQYRLPFRTQHNFSAESFFAQVHYSPPALRRTCMLCPNSHTQLLGDFQLKDAVSGESQRLGEAKRVQLGSYPDESITSLNDWLQDLVIQRISLPGSY